MILIDADILAYRLGFACNEDTEEAALSELDNTIATILVECGMDAAPYQLFLTGSTNFRNEIAVTAPYKGTRKAEKPVHFKALRDHMVNVWGAIVTDGIEADDAIATVASTIDDCIMVSIDKDFLQVAGTHYNFVKQKFTEVNEWEGLLFLYTQMLTGDRVDNIKGVAGIGEKKAAKILADCTTEKELYDAVLAAYDGNVELLYENALLLYLRRYDNEVWVDPYTREANGKEAKS